MRQYWGVIWQRVNYDQLSLTQWVHGFWRNILEESDGHRKDTMVAYLADLMEDATDFSWQGAKAARAVLICEMERGTVKWEDGDSTNTQDSCPKTCFAYQAKLGEAGQ